ncbi:neuropeptide Y receptor type 1-like [Orbicella faveolata]|uniref:neuropeptide Y receptor type 1-like n=1 Tax=Orbicella faveolata TaxID=48498 RepID=UPI0009E28A2E|nr:neuropeptide Y receptor type 1-like [Orbicella faveolata]
MANISVNTSLYNSLSPFNVALVVLYSIIVVVGLAGNSLVIAIVCKTRSMFTPTNILLANVAAADIISLLWCPIPLVIGLSGTNISGETADYICKFFTGYSVTCITVPVTFLSLMILAVERFHAIVKPFNSALALTNNRMGFVIAFIWIMAAALSLPGFIYSKYDEQLGRCLDPWTLEKAGSVQWLFVMQLGLSFPFSCCLFYCYFQILKGIFINRTVCSAETASSRQSNVKEKRKLALISFTVTVAYHLCYLPFLVFELYTAFQPYQAILDNYEDFYKVYRVVGFVMYVNSCLNPFFYGFQSSNYRKNFIRLFTRKTMSDNNSMTLW